MNFTDFFSENELYLFIVKYFDALWAQFLTFLKTSFLMVLEESLNI